MSSSGPPSSSSSSLRTSVTSTADSTPWQSPILNGRSRFTSPKTWAGDRSSANAKSRPVNVESELVATRRGSSGSQRSANRSKTISSSGEADRADVDPSGFTIPYRTTSTGSEQAKTNTPSSIEPVSSSRDQWWEHVLPPGQLAERLRQAQASSSSKSVSATLAPSEEGPKASRKSILRNATPAERKTWTSLSDFGLEDGRVEGSRSGFNSTRSSVGTIPSMRSDGSTAGSLTEDHFLDGPSPTGREDDYFPISWDRSATASPTHSISRSTTCRRSRVLGEGGNNDSIGLGIASSKSSSGGNLADFDDRFRQWSFSHIGSTGSHNNLLRPFPSGGRDSPRHVLSQTPEVSSEEEQGLDTRSRRSSTTTTTTRRVTRTLSTVSSIQTVGSTPVSSKRQSMPATTMSSRSSTEGLPHRHVSFRQKVDVSGDDGKWESQTIGRAAGRSHSMRASDATSKVNKRASWQHPEAQRRSTRPFPTIGGEPPNFSNPSQFMPHLRGRRIPSHSAPTSPQAAFKSLYDDRHSRHRQETRVTSPPRSESTTSKLPDLALLSSLGAAQNQLASAGNMALTLTRQLSIPLRPMLQLTMFLSISSFTFMALAGFLVAGYLITAWDDVNNRGKRIQSNVYSATKSLEAGVHWCEKLVAGEPDSADNNKSSSGLSSDDATAGPSSSSSSRHRRIATSRVFTAPLRFAFVVPATIAYKLTPTAISESFARTSSNTASTGRPQHPRPSSSGSSSRTGDSTMPPRPPLSSLLPSILLTIVIALGAGLASFFAERAATSSSPSGASSPVSPSSTHFAHAATAAAAAAASSGTVPSHHSSQVPPIRKRGSVSSHHSTSSSQYSRRHSLRSYDVI